MARRPSPVRRTITTELGTLLDRVAEHVELPRGTRLGVKIGHRRLRSDFRFARPVLSKNEAVSGRENNVTVQDAIRQFVIPRLPKDLRKKARIVVFEPGKRRPAGPVRLAKAREWGDGRTIEQGEEFDLFIEDAYDKLLPIWDEIVEDIGSEEIFLRAVCKLFDNPKLMIDIIKKHK